MERIKNVNAKRLQWCLQEHGIDVAQLAAETGVPAVNAQQVLDGLDGFTFNQLRKVADYFGRGVLFFLETGAVNAEQVHSLQFRTINNQKTKLSTKVRRLVENVERQRDVYLNLVENLTGEPVPAFESPTLSITDPVRAATAARVWLGLSQENSFSAYRKAVEDRGILVFLSNGYAGKWQIAKADPICGFTLAHPLCPLIFVKKQAAEVRQTFTLMHELGHLLMHRDSFIDAEDDLYSHAGKEKDANAFAGHLLVPTQALKAVDFGMRPRDVSQYDEWLKPIRQSLGVSTEVVLRRLLDHGGIDDKSYMAYRAWKLKNTEPDREGGNRAFRHREPIHVFGDPFVRTVLDSLHARAITLSRASTYLDNLKIAYVHKLESAYATP